jgi:primosomal protein N' (replication factor Y)
MGKERLFADVLLPLPLPGYFTYSVPEKFNSLVGPGQRVAVQFGRKKIYSGLIRRLHSEHPQHKPKTIVSVIDEKPVVTELLFRFWEWMAGYYLCTPGEVMNAALPPGLKLSSETGILLNPGFDFEVSGLNEKEMMVTEALLARKKLTIQDVIRITDLQKVLPLIRNLIDKGVIVTEEELKTRYKPRKEVYVRLTKELEEDEQALQAIFDELGKRAFRQLQVLISYINLTRGSGKRPELSRKQLMESVDTTSAVIKAMEKKGIFILYEKETSRFETFDGESSVPSIELSDSQQHAFGKIKADMADKDVVLLHGITSSGKTELYIKLIDETVRRGKQVLYLLPEIALTSQIINRLRKYFGSKAAVYHSRYNENERVEVWNNILAFSPGSEKATPAVLGARSALFLPYSDLGLIIVDEEHDSSFKQDDPAPRYNARDAAIFLAAMHGAKVLLGTATPSLESYHNAQKGKYGLVEMNERYGGMQEPEIEIANIMEESRRRTMRSHFSSHLINLATEALSGGEQVILFQNRRGFSPRVECDACHWIPYCIHCDISLTYHKSVRQLKCHYCGYSVNVPQQCPECGSHKVLTRGFGTQKIEEDLAIIYPEARIQRMDLDATRSKFAHQKIIEAFEEQKIDILVGTQMVTKGLDFDHVSLVGILNADNMINFPDFRAHERSFHLMEQVSGRAGRKHKRGKVVIQTFHPDHPIIQFVIHHDFKGMARYELAQRRKFRYPPYFRLINIRVKHKESGTVNRAASVLAGALRDLLGKRVLGPEYPPVTRVRGLYVKHILIKLERDPQLPAHKREIMKVIDKLSGGNEFRRVRILVDVDPL